MVSIIFKEIDFYQLFWLMCVYSVGGWVAETIVGIVRNKRFINKGFLNGPYCIIYGIAAVIVTVGFEELQESLLFLFVGSAVLCTVIEWIAAKSIEKVAKVRLWDYSGKRFNLDGYICLQYSMIWGLIGTIGLKYCNPFLNNLYRLLNGSVFHICLWIVFWLLAVDFAGSYFAARGMAEKYPGVESVNNTLTIVRTHLGNWMADHMERRLKKAYPQGKRQGAIRVKSKDEVFAQGCSFYKLFLLFVIGAFLGDITETIYCRLAGGVWMSRSSVVWGPFSIVWGLAMMFATSFLYNYRTRSDSFIFWFGTIMGGVYEYLCSVFTEVMFGQVFWDYSSMPFNLGGRINLLYCFFWGMAAVVWIKRLFPVISSYIEKIPVHPGKMITWVLVVFMSCNMLLSGMVLARYSARTEGAEAQNTMESWIDSHYNDQKVERIYPNMKDAKEK